MGKGREIAGIILDNMRQGRKKAVWLSAKQGLVRDAKRDFAGVSGNPDLIVAQNKTKADGVIAAKYGILFTTYDTLASGMAPANGATARRRSPTSSWRNCTRPAPPPHRRRAEPLQIVK